MFHVEQLGPLGPDWGFCSYRSPFPDEGTAEVDPARMFHVEHSCICGPRTIVRARLDRDGQVLAVKAKKDDDSEEGRGEQYLYDTVIQDLLVGVGRIGKVEFFVCGCFRSSNWIGGGG